MTTNEHAEIHEVIRRVFIEQMGGRASLEEVFRALAGDMPEHLRNHILATGLKTAIRSYFRRQTTDGLPQAPEANEDGTHVQLEFLEVAEYRFVIGRQLDRSSAFRVQAEKLAARCEAIHGVTIPLDPIQRTNRAASA